MHEHTVLFVDDEAHILKTLGRLLRSMPIDVLTAETPDQAMLLLAKAQPQVVVSDYHMPGMSGVEIGDEEERKMARTEAIILSMTKKERETPRLLKGSRLKRVANGSGVQVRDVNALLKQFGQMQKMMKMMNGGKGRKMMKAMKAQMAENGGQMPGLPGM